MVLSATLAFVKEVVIKLPGKMGFLKSFVWHCLRCDHEWPPKATTAPKNCANPRCKSPYWFKPREPRKKKD